MKQLFIFFLFFLPSFGGAGGGPIFAQLPTCHGPSSDMIYFVGNNGTNSPTTIYNYNPSQPISSVNPSVNSISLPTGSNGTLSVNENLNASSPSPTFYTIVASYYYYYNGTSWVNTGHTAGPTTSYPIVGIAGGGGYIYSLRLNKEIYQYDGTGNAVLLTTLNIVFGNVILDLSADCYGNFYIIDPGMGLNWLHKYNSNGNLSQSWTVSGGSSVGGGGFAIIGNNVYYGTAQGPSTSIIDTLWTGPITVSSTININAMGSIYITPNIVPGSFGSCPVGNFTAVASTDTAHYDCNSGVPDTLIAYGASPFTWSVISGPAIINGTGDTVSITSSGNSTIVLSSNPYTYCGTNTDTITLVYTPLDTTLISTNSPLCVGDTLKLNALNALGATYLWHGPVSYSSSYQHAKRPNMVLADSGYYSVTVNFSGCSGSDSAWVNVKPLPVVPSVGSNSPVCVGDSLKLTVSSPQTGATYSWNGPGAYSATVQSPVRPNAQLSYSGNYTDTAILNGCRSMASTAVIVNPVLGPPTVNISVLPGDTVCMGTNLSFSATATNASSPQYHWKKNGSNTGPNAASFSTPSAGSGDIFTCSISSNATCQPVDTAMSNAITIYEIPYTTPTVSISSQPAIILPLHTDTFTATVNACSNPGYQWYKNGGKINGATGNVYIGSIFASDHISVTVHCSGPCLSPDSAVSNQLTTTGVGTSPVLSKGEVTVWPNPMGDELNIQIVGQAANNSIGVRIYDIVGRVVYTSSPSERTGEVYINTHNFSKGTYILELLSSDGGREIRKIVK